MHQQPLWRRALRLVYYQHIYSAVLTAALIVGMNVVPATALVCGFVVGAVAYGRLQRSAFSPEVDRREWIGVIVGGHDDRGPGRRAGRRAVPGSCLKASPRGGDPRRPQA